MIDSIRVKVSVAALLLLVTFPYLSSICNAEDSASVWQQTDEAIRLAFNAALDAEKAGANVTDMLSKLNLAVAALGHGENVSGIDLSQIQAAYSSARSVQAAASNAKIQALDASRERLLSTVVFSLVGSLVFVLVLFGVWHRYKRYLESSLIN
jgi:hypothetical protein